MFPDAAGIGNRPRTEPAARDVSDMMFAVEATYIGKQRTIGAGSGAFWTVAPCVIAAGRDHEDPAHQPDRPLAGMVAPDRPLAGMVADELETHFGTSAKMPIAFLG